MKTDSICCRQCHKAFLDTDSLWFCCSSQRNKNLYCCIKCKQKRCLECLSNRRHTTSYVIAQEQMRKSYYKKQPRTTHFRKTQNLFQKNQSFRLYEERNFSRTYKQNQQNQAEHIPTSIKRLNYFNEYKSPQKKKIFQNIYLDKKCQKQYLISQIHEINSKSNSYFVILPCRCQIKKEELSEWLKQKCLICGKKQQLKTWRTILRQDSYACNSCLSKLQSTVKYGMRATLQQKKTYQYLNSLCYKCLQCQKLIKNTASMSQQSYLTLNKPDQFILCKQCSFYSKKHQNFVLGKISIQRQKQLQQKRKYQLFNFFDKKCDKYYHISYIHQLFSQYKKQPRVKLPCGCKVQKNVIQDWIKDKCLVCGKISQNQYLNSILKNDGNICDTCNNRLNLKSISKQDKQLLQYIDSLRYICMQCNHDITRKQNLSQSQLDDEEFVLCQHCYKSLKYRELIYQQSAQKRENLNYNKKVEMQKKQFSNQKKQEVKRPRYNAKYEPDLTQKGKCPVCQQVYFLSFVQDLGMSICFSCKGKNSSSILYEQQQSLNKQKLYNGKLKPQCHKCGRLIIANQWLCFKQDGKLICKFCKQKQQPFSNQPQMKQKMKSVKQPQEELSMKSKIFQRNDFSEQKQIQNESPKKKSQKSQNFQRNIKDKFSGIKQSKIQNVQKKIIIQNQNGYHQTHSRHIKEQQINQNGQKKIKQQKYNTQVKKSHRNQSSQRISNISQSKSNSDLKKSLSKQSQKQDQINKKNENFQRKDQSMINEDSLDVHQFLHKNQKILPDQISLFQMNKISGIKDSNEKRFIDLKNASLQQNQTIEKVLQKLNDQSFEVQVVPINMKKQQSLKEQRISEQSQRNQSISFGALENNQPQQNNFDSYKSNQVQDSLQASNLKNQKKLKEDLNSDENSLISESEPKLVSISVKQNNFIKKEAQLQIQKKQAQKIVVRKPIFQKSKNQINSNPDPDHDPQIEKQFAIIQNQQIQIQFQQEDKFQTCMECGYLTKITELFIIRNEQKIFVAKQENQRQQFQGIKMCKSCYVFQQSVLKMTQFQNSKKKSASNSKYRQMKSIQKNEPISLKRYTSSEKRKQKQRLDDLSSTQIPANKRYDYAYGQIGQGVSKEGLNLIRDKLKMGNQKTENQKDIYSQKYNLTGKVQKKDQIKVKQNYCQVCKRPTVVLFFDKYCSECFKKV